ncbi:MAG: WG repeat-containing protein [Clostridia bacterium]|nr:WG repeat-containing protein [Clostridia bacterium]
MSENLVPYVTAAAAGDTDAMGKLYAKTLKGAYFLATRLCDADDAPAEIVKQAYAKAFCNLDRLKRPEAFEIWMKQNVAGAYKDSKNFVFNEADGAAMPVTAEFLDASVLEDPAMGDAVLQAVAALKPELRTALVLHYNNGMPVQALSRFLGVSDSTANALLSAACAQVVEATGAPTSAVEPAGGLPVLTQLFQRLCAGMTVVTSDVRDIFIYAKEAFEKYQMAKAANAVPPTASDPDSAQYFKQRIHESLESGAPVDAPVLANAAVQTPAPQPEMPAMPEMPAVSDEPSGFSVPEPDEAPFKLDLPDEADEPAPSGKRGGGIKLPKGVNLKTIALAAVALLLLILLCAGIGKAVKKHKENTGKTGTEVTTQAGKTAVLDSTFTWKPGGFSDCTEIQYLDENYCKFKSASSGQWGLMDYQDKVVIQPRYEDFVRCGYGREYDASRSTPSYHSLVVMGGDKYDFTVESNGNVKIANSPHAAHTVDGDKLETASYDERDRYFEGYAAARKDGKWGYVNEKGKKVIPYEYEQVNEMSASYESSCCDFCRPVTGGLIAVKKGGMMGIIDLKNNTVVNFEYSNILPGKDGVFIACKAGTWGVILVGNAQNTFSGVNMDIQDNNADVSTPSGNGGTKGEKYQVSDYNGANIRDGAGVENEWLGELDYGDEIEVLGFETADNGNDWAKFEYDGQTAYVAMSKLEKVTDTDTTTQEQEAEDVG